MKKILTLSLLFLFSLCAVAQQQILLLTETFETGSNIFEYDSGGVGTNTAPMNGLSIIFMMVNRSTLTRHRRTAL
ncbi:MAG: hypothetical protein IPN22_00330 [Bacteroidetes bacterium]|nr:hypothetical protein [Bacteroidota bacterium]